MKIEKIILENYRGFEKEEIIFSENNINVFIGINGAGKTSLLDAVAYGFELWIRKELHLRVGDKDLKEVYEKFGLINTSIYSLPISPFNFLQKGKEKGSLNCLFVNKEFEIGVYKEFDYQIVSSFSPKTISKTLPKLFKNEYHSLPIFIYYTTFQFNKEYEKEGTVKHIPKIKQLNAYENICTYLNDYSLFEKWFKNQEDYENQQKINLKNLDYRNANLEIVRQALERFFREIENPFFKDLKIQRFENEDFDFKNPTQNYSLVINKNEVSFYLDELSSGEKNLLLLVCDIARRLSIANPALSVEDILQKGEGIILIDEVEQHLHPKWQRKILSALEKTFPSLQFIVTTHSPQVLSGTAKENVFILDNFKISKQKVYVEGRDSNSILEDAFHFSKYSSEMKSKIDDFYKFLENDIEKAEKILTSIKEKFGEYDLEVKRASMYLEDEKYDLEDENDNLE